METSPQVGEIQRICSGVARMARVVRGARCPGRHLPWAVSVANVRKLLIKYTSKFRWHQLHVFHRKKETLKCSNSERVTVVIAMGRSFGPSGIYIYIVVRFLRRAAMRSAIIPTAFLSGVVSK